MQSLVLELQAENVSLKATVAELRIDILKLGEIISNRDEQIAELRAALFEQVEKMQPRLAA